MYFYFIVILIFTESYYKYLVKHSNEFPALTQILLEAESHVL